MLPTKTPTDGPTQAEPEQVKAREQLDYESLALAHRAREETSLSNLRKQAQHRAKEKELLQLLRLKALKAKRNTDHEAEEVHAWTDADTRQTQATRTAQERPEREEATAQADAETQALAQVDSAMPAQLPKQNSVVPTVDAALLHALNTDIRLTASKVSFHTLLRTPLTCDNLPFAVGPRGAKGGDQHC